MPGYLIDHPSISDDEKRAMRAAGYDLLPLHDYNTAQQSQHGQCVAITTTGRRCRNHIVDGRGGIWPFMAEDFTRIDWIPNMSHLARASVSISAAELAVLLSEMCGVHREASDG